MSNSEGTVVPYEAGLPQARVALVLAPHSDDEVLGCGGTLALLAKAGTPVRVVVATDSSFGAGFPEGSDPMAVRRSESIAAAQVLGYPAPEFWALPDRGLRYGPALVERIVHEIQASGADLIFAPHAGEAHPDHRAMALAAIEAIGRVPSCRLLQYEVSMALAPEVLVDITAVLETKKAAMGRFVSQLATRAYDRYVDGLNRYRAYTLGPEVLAAEAFRLVTSDAASRRNGPNASVAGTEPSRAPVVGPDEEGPTQRVTVIVRSVDRPTLSQALDSVAAQTHANVEILVVDASGRHRPLPTEWNGVALRLVGRGKPLRRAEAANVGLNEARGKWLLFLDDDDLLLPNHLERLVAASRKAGRAAAPYAGVRVVDAEGREIARYDDPEAADRLWSTNVLPIHAVLFPRRVIVEGALFDETLDLYEDWDFWLRLLAHVRYVHVPGVSAIYRTALGGSDAAAAGDPAKRALARLAVLHRWLPRLTPARYDAVLDLERRRGADEALAMRIERG
jgi:LmbE family N-acetylglucosaminyl deacetylase